MVSAGLAVDNCIRLLRMQTKNPTFQKVLDKVYQDILAGKALSESLGQFPRYFDSFYIAVVRSGETLGKLDSVLTHLADQMELFQSFASKIKSALAYPIFIVVAMVGVVVVMMVKVVPTLKTVFADAGAELPFATKVVMATSDFLVLYWWLVLIILVILVISIVLVFRKTERGRWWWDTIKLKAPLINYVSYDINMSRFARTMAMLMQAGVPIIESIKITMAIMNNRIYTKILKNVILQVERGIPMSVPLEKEKDFTILTTQMIMIGEQTGRMEMLLGKVADYYEDETDTKIKTISSLIEPITIVVIGIGVAFVLYSILYPIYSLTSVIK
jgi:type IV pilus assembly protein PilC